MPAHDVPVYFVVSYLYISRAGQAGTVNSSVCPYTHTCMYVSFRAEAEKNY